MFWKRLAAAQSSGRIDGKKISTRYVLVTFRRTVQPHVISHLAPPSLER